MASKAKVSSYSSTPIFSYDVFLSFRGADTRRSFTDHLYYALNQSRIFTFRDDERLESGKIIESELFNAIEESRIAVVVISKSYASSSWCLKEMSKIIECKKRNGLIILPVFYYVERSEVRDHLGSFGEAFSRREVTYKDSMEIINKWKADLTEMADFHGWVLNERNESEIIQEIVKEISGILSVKFLGINKGLIGIDSRIQKLEFYLDTGLDTVCSIGIMGMGGVGKTTMAEEIFRRLSNQFDACCYIAYIREEAKRNGLVHLQRIMYKELLDGDDANIPNVDVGRSILRHRLSSKRVLIILDDVDDIKQIEAVVGKNAEKRVQLGSGSKVIVTTRDKHLLETYGVDKIYEVEKLNKNEALQLLCWKAFKEYQYPSNEFKELSEDIIEYTGRLPLALEVLGSSLFEKNLKEWSDILARLKYNPSKEILLTLQVSIDGLEHTERQIFLDIACFFNGEDQHRVKKILQSCHFFPKIGIRVLMDKSLVKIERNKLWMHELLQKTGWNMVRQQSPLDPGKRSRLWFHKMVYNDNHDNSWINKDIFHVLEHNTGTNKIEGIFLSLPEEKELHLHADPLSKMVSLRLLKIHNVGFPRYLEHVSNELRLLEWYGYPLESLPSSFQAEKLVELNLSNGHIRQLWKEFQLSSEQLVLINLAKCQYLTKTPDCSMVPNLERLILEGCNNLSDVHPSIGNLPNLVFLNLKGCSSLENLPESINLESLEILILSGCVKLAQFPEVACNMEYLSELHLDGTAITTLPESIKHLPGLIFLNLRGCKNLLTLPSIICGLKSLKKLNLSDCSCINHLPENIGSLDHLQDLDVSGTSIRKVPSSIGSLINLEKLSFRGCNLAQGAIPDDIGCLSTLQHLDLSENNFVSIPESISELSKLEELNLSKCSQLQSLPKRLPLSLRHVYARNCPMMTTHSDEYTTWVSEKGFTIVDRRKTENEDGKMYFLPIPDECIDTLFPQYIEDGIYHEEHLIIIYPHDKVPDWCSHSSKGSSARIKLSLEDSNCTWMGLAVCVVIEIHGNENFDEIWELKEIYFQFYTNEGRFRDPIIARPFKHFGIGLFGICCYLPRGPFSERLHKATQIRVLVSTNRPLTEVKMCGMHLVFQQDVATFARNLARTASEGYQDLDFLQHCKQISDDAKKVQNFRDIDFGCGLWERECALGKLDQQDCASMDIASLVNQGSKRALVIQSKQELQSFVSILFEENNARGYSFYFTFPYKICAPWFLHHCPGNLAVCYPPQNMFDDKTWVGLEFYAQFHWHLSTSTDNVSHFLVDIYIHGRGVSRAVTVPIMINGSLGTRQTVVLHIPRLLFPENLSNCCTISALLKTNTGDVEVEICGARLVFEQDLDALIQVIMCSPELLWQARAYGEMINKGVYSIDISYHDSSKDGMPIFCNSIFRREIVESLQKFLTSNEKAAASNLNVEKPFSELGRIEGEIPLACNFSLQRKLIESLQNLMTSAEKVAERVCTSLKKYRCHLGQKQCFIFHNEQYILHHWDVIQEGSKSLTATSILNHLQIMAETPLYHNEVSKKWKALLQTYLRIHFKHGISSLVTLNLKGHILSALKPFDPSSSFNFAFPRKDILPWFECQSKTAWAGVIPYPKLYADKNWTGLVVCASFSVHEHPTSILNNLDSEESFNLLCHLETDKSCMSPVGMFSITREKFTWLYLGGFIWLTYIPRWLLMELNDNTAYVKARVCNNCPGLAVKMSAIRVLYQNNLEDFNEAIIHCWTSFFDNLDIIRHYIADKDERAESPQHEDKEESSEVDDRTCQAIDNITLHGEHFKDFDQDEIYNSCFPSTQIPEWFTHCNCDSSVTIQLPQDDNWTGLALCAYFSMLESNENPISFPNNVDPGISHHLDCHFGTEKQSLETLHCYHTTNEAFNLLADGGFIWISYIPRSWFSDQLNQCSQMEASFASESRGLWAQTCGLRLVYEFDNEHFKQVISICTMSLLKVNVPICHLMFNNGETSSQYHERPKAMYRGETSGTVGIP